MTFQELLLFEECRHFGAFRGKDSVTNLVYHSGAAHSGCVFFAYPGASSDGHDHVLEAYSRGCRLFLAEREVALPEDADLRLVSSARRSMARLASRFYGEPDRQMTVIGITGTKGKTTVSIMLKLLLEGAGRRVGYIGTEGVIIGKEKRESERTTPESPELFSFMREMRDCGCDTCILEVSSQGLALGRVEGIRFSHTIFTNLACDHIGAGEHKTMKEYAEAKLSLFRDYGCRVLVYPVREPFSVRILQESSATKRISYGVDASADYAADGVFPVFSDKPSTGFYLSLEGRRFLLELPLTGRHYVSDFLAALAMAREITREPIETFLPLVSRLSIEGRSVWVPLSSPGLFCIDYAHNGLGLASALRGVRPYAERRLICVFGSVGGRSYCRRRDMAEAASEWADFSVLTEDNPGKEDPGQITDEIYRYFPDKSRVKVIKDRAEAIRYVVNAAEEGDVILLAGKGSEEFQMTGEGRVYFSERALLERFSRERERNETGESAGKMKKEEDFF